MPVTIAVGLIALLAPLYMAFFVDYLALGLYGAPIATGCPCLVDTGAVVLALALPRLINHVVLAASIL